MSERSWGSECGCFQVLVRIVEDAVLNIYPILFNPYAAFNIVNVSFPLETPSSFGSQTPHSPDLPSALLAAPSQCPLLATPHLPICNPGMCPDQKLSRSPLASWVPAEPHWMGTLFYLYSLLHDLTHSHDFK